MLWSGLWQTARALVLRAVIALLVLVVRRLRLSEPERRAALVRVRAALADSGQAPST